MVVCVRDKVLGFLSFYFQAEAGKRDYDVTEVQTCALPIWFTGRYYSDEIETFYNLTLEQDQLTLHQRRMDDAELSPGEADTFSGGGFTFSFERDRNEQVIGFYLSNVRTRGVRFARQ